MDLLLLPGDGRNSNEQWIQDVADAVSGSFGRVSFIRYAHWALPDGEGVMNVERELEKVRQAIDDLVADPVSDYVVFAKSAGSALYLRALHEGARPPVSAVLVGIPMKSADNPTFAAVLGEAGFPAVLRGYAVPTIIIQNETERFIKPRDLRRFLQLHAADTNSEVRNGSDQGHTYTVPVVSAAIRETVEKYGME